jgi:peptide/nickel transport system permease protein
MAITEERTAPETPDWQEELEHVGLVRRMLQARRWYKADWWFVVISSVAVVLFFIVAIFPQWFAPHDPREEVGARVLAPGEAPAFEVFLVPAGSEVSGLVDMATGERESFGVVVGEPTSDVARDEVERLNQEGLTGDERLRLRLERFDDLPEMLTSLSAGELVAAGAASDQVDLVIDDFPGVEVAGPIAEGDESAGESFLLGTNQLGQDMLSRIIWGTRVAFLIGFASAVFAIVLGVPLGLLAGFAGGKLDRGMSLIMDSLYAFPGLILAIAIAAVLGPSVFNVIVAIAVLYIPTYFRIVRGQTLSAKEELYVEAARSLGAKSTVILRRYIFPNVIPSVAIIFSVNVADAILTGAGLSFLGIGLPPDTPDWGIDLARGQQSIQTAWWLVTFPGIAVMLVVLSFTMMGEGLVEMFNPKLRER